MKIKSLLAAGVFSLLSASAIAQLPYQNPALSPRERAEDLCSRLTLEEKSKLMMNGSPAIERLGIPAFEWWSEALHGVGRNGLATVFPSCIGMSASFNDDLIENVFTAISDEARAKNNEARRLGKGGKYKGLSFWTPTVNIFRDPRWGRGQETYGEDPYMNGRMGIRVVRGLQGDNTDGYYKLLACAKHFAVHSGPESSRHSLNIADLPARDLWESYLPAFEDLVKKANVRQVMCAYQRLDGQACCGSDRLLQHILRDWWDFDGVVVSDCGAINDFYLPKRHGVSEDAIGASALGAKSGTDVECGSNYKHLPKAVKRGEISEADIDRNVIRLLTERFAVGDFDHEANTRWNSIPMSVVASAKHRALARQMGRESMVLLKNNGILPLPKSGKKIMVMGPNATDSTMMWGIYYGQPAMTVTILDGIENKIGKVPYRKTSTITRLREDQSLMGLMRDSLGRQGMHATYWNNTEMKGTPAAEANYASPISLDNGGNTAFAPGVNLSNFTARIKGRYTADRDETLRIIYNNDDGLRIIINGDTVHERWKYDPLNFRDRELAVEKGKTYDIEVDYMQLEDDATLGFDILRNIETDIADIVESAHDADVIIYAGGISPALEREQARVNEPGFHGGDRTSIELPQCQRDILAALHAAGKQIVLVNCSGSPVALTPEDKICDAILEAWYAGEEGGNAVADVLFGDYNPSGKLPVTFYASDAQLPDFEDYRLEGRTYRFLREEPLYKFGHGLSYTTFEYSKPKFKKGQLTVKVKNTGAVAGTETVQVYVKRNDDTEGPVKTLRQYARVELQPGETKTVTLPMPEESFLSWDAKKESMEVVPGKYSVMVGGSSDEKDLKTITVKI